MEKHNTKVEYGLFYRHLVWSLHKTHSLKKKKKGIFVERGKVTDRTVLD